MPKKNARSIQSQVVDEMELLCHPQFTCRWSEARAARYVSGEDENLPTRNAPGSFVTVTSRCIERCY